VYVNSLVSNLPFVGVASSPSFSGTLIEDLTPGDTYRITIQAALIDQAFGDISASIDPFFSIDPSVSLGDEYSFSFSDGIGNSPASVPEPSSLDVFAACCVVTLCTGWVAPRFRSVRSAATPNA
jgi:hypothetical protein